MTRAEVTFTLPDGSTRKVAGEVMGCEFERPPGDGGVDEAGWVLKVPGPVSFWTIKIKEKHG